MQRVAWGVAAGVFAVLAGGSVQAQTPGEASVAAEPVEFVLSPEGNHLWAYAADTGEHQLLARAQNGADPAAAAPNGLVRDINGQICVSPDGHHVVTGEDTVLEGASGPDGGDSHDPRIAGWGFFRIDGDRLGELTIEQVGKLAPEAGRGDGYTGDPDNYGCGFLDERRLFTSALGNTFFGEPANGQLFLWFGPFDTGFRQEGNFFVGEVDHCQIDDTLATAGGIQVLPDGSVLVAANRPTDIPGGDPSAVWRYSGTWPTSFDECTPEFLAANVTKTRVLPTLPLPVDVRAPTPSAVLALPDGHILVSSVFSGTVAEYDLDGAWVRDIFPLSPVTPFTGPTGQTPFGLARTSDGSVWIADLGIVGDAPSDGEGSLIRLRFDENGDPVLPAETVRDGLTFPDGVGVYTAYRAPTVAGTGTGTGAEPPPVVAAASGGARAGGPLARTGAASGPALLLAGAAAALALFLRAEGRRA